MTFRDGNIKHLVHWLQFVVFGSVFLVFCLIYFGFADPQPVAAPIMIDVDGLSSCAQLDPFQLPDSGTAQLIFTSIDRAYIQVGADVEPAFELVLDSVGYISLADGEALIRPLATFPHIDTHVNEVWLDWVDGTAVSIRINRELYWQGEIPFDHMELRIHCA